MAALHQRLRHGLMVLAVAWLAGVSALSAAPATQATDWQALRQLRETYQRDPAQLAVKLQEFADGLKDPAQQGIRRAALSELRFLYSSLATRALAQGKPDEALADADKAVALAEQGANPADTARAQVGAMEVLLAAGKQADADARLVKVGELLAPLPPESQVVGVWVQAARVLHKAGRKQDTEMCIGKAVECTEKLTTDRYSALMQLGGLYAGLGRMPEACDCFARARPELAKVEQAMGTPNAQGPFDQLMLRSASRMGIRMGWLSSFVGAIVRAPERKPEWTRSAREVIAETDVRIKQLQGQIAVQPNGKDTPTFANAERMLDMMAKSLARMQQELAGTGTNVAAGPGAPGEGEAPLPPPVPATSPAAPPTAPAAPAAPPAAGALNSPAKTAPAAEGPVPITPELLALAKELCAEGEQHLKRKQYADAEACFRMVLLSLPGSARAKAGLAKCR